MMIAEVCGILYPWAVADIESSCFFYRELLLLLTSPETVMFTNGASPLSSPCLSTLITALQMQRFESNTTRSVRIGDYFLCEIISMMGCCQEA